ncbi:hypothetical protein WJX81_001103 [Elliptochloris bilobata]|uniref:Glyoxal oxidase n=1 Tax=Elliptochloris bilobata TaxID=381761 RepID=A0AAW1RNV5_9CHLO
MPWSFPLSRSVVLLCTLAVILLPNSSAQAGSHLQRPAQGGNRLCRSYANTFIMIDRIFYGSEAPNPWVVKGSEYDVATDTYRNISGGILTNSFCSTGGVLPGGLVVDLGGGGDQLNPAPDGGGNNVRLFQTCGDSTCQFDEALSKTSQRLLTYRWYPSSINTADGRLLITSGMVMGEGTGQWYVARLAPGNATTNYITKGPGFLDPRCGDGGTPITYPGSGTSFMLPLRPPYTSVIVVACGGSWANFNTDAFVDTDCAIITPTDPSPVSSRAGGVTMINKRVMPYCINLLDGNVVCVGGAGSGGLGYYAPINPVLQVDLLNTTTLRFSAEQSVAMTNPGFSTHSLQMSQRYVQLSCTCATPVARPNSDGSTYIATVQCICIVPVSANVTPPGDYLLTLLDGLVPSPAQWISIG